MIPGVVVTADGGLAFDPEIADDTSRWALFAFAVAPIDAIFDWIEREVFALNGYFE